MQGSRGGSMNDKFSIAVKGILYYKGKYLLRKNQRDEFELLGGKLEKDDISMEDRLIEEFLEESGINIRVHSPREPWLYTVGSKNIIIFPFLCSVVDIPDELFDQDGGELLWFDASELESLNIPSGYLNSINGKVPGRSSSLSKGKYFKIIPNYTEDKYEVIICTESLEDGVTTEKKLQNFISPRESIEKLIKNKEILSISSTIKGSSIYINYILS